MLDPTPRSNFRGNVPVYNYEFNLIKNEVLPFLELLNSTKPKSGASELSRKFTFILDRATNLYGE